jgi:hypothetical protein
VSGDTMNTTSRIVMSAVAWVASPFYQSISKKDYRLCPFLFRLRTSVQSSARPEAVEAPRIRRTWGLGCAKAFWPQTAI